MSNLNDKCKLKPIADVLTMFAIFTGMSAFAAEEADIQKAIDHAKKHEKEGAVKAGGFGMVSADGESSINLTGIVHYDGCLVRSNLPRVTDKDSASVADGFEFRRVRLGVNGTVYKDVDYEVIVNATGADTNILETGFLNFSAVKDVQIRVGRFRQPYSLEAMTKDNAIDFLERSYGDQLGPNKQLGVGVWGEPRKGFTYALAVSQAGFNEATNVDNIGGLGTGRATVNLGELSNMDGQVIHLGASTHRGKYDVVPTTSTDTFAASDGKTRATLLSYRTESRGLANAYRVQIGGETLSTVG
jgi:phosphate-selective porin OprO/OprP